MLIKDYLSQAYRLNQRISSNIEELSRLQEMSCSLSSPKLGDKVQTSKNTDAPFVNCLEKIEGLQNVINDEIEKLMSLKQQLRTVIDDTPNIDERLVLRYRYIHNLTWEQIGYELHADSRTVRRWHNEALRNVKMPENPIWI